MQYTLRNHGITYIQKLKSKNWTAWQRVNKLKTTNQGSVFVTLLQMLGVNVSGKYYSTGNKEERINAWAQFISFIYFRAKWK
jgi:hypothetical protein